MPPVGNFNSHTREGVTSSGNLNELPLNFNSHTREGVTGVMANRGIKGTDFNSHTREGVTLVLFNVLHIFNFNSHTREGVTEYARILLRSPTISTHTPVRV